MDRSRRTPSTARASPALAWGVAVAAAALALVVRWRLLGGTTGLAGYHGYDDGVYYAAAAALVHGDVPYRDFLLLHPPGVVLALAPFAALAGWFGDPAALAAARVAFLLVGAANALLVVRIAQRWGVAAATVGGVLYAVSAAAAAAERLTLLEPLGTLTLLGGVLLLVRAAEADPGRARALVAVGGAVLGLGATVKIWNVVPIAVVLAWQWVDRGRRVAALAGLGALASAVCVLAPFAVLAGPTMLRYVVLDQLGRRRNGADARTRLESITGVDGSVVADAATAGATARDVVLAAVLVVVAGAAVLAWRAGVGRLWGVLLLAQTAVLLLSPSYLPHYAAYSAAALVLVVAAGVAAVPALPRAAVAATACLTLGLAGGALRPEPVRPFPAAQIRAHLPADGCVQADAPATLALLDLLSANLERGCRVPVDLSGQTYHVGSRDAAGRPLPRVRNEPWQRAVLDHLTAGSAAVLARGRGNGFDEATTRALDRFPTVFRSGGVRVLLVGADDAGPDDR